MKRALTQLRKLEREIEARRVARRATITVMHWLNKPMAPEIPIGPTDRVTADFVLQFVSNGRLKNQRIAWVQGYERLARAANDFGSLYDGRADSTAPSYNDQSYGLLPHLEELCEDGLSGCAFAVLFTSTTGA